MHLDIVMCSCPLRRYSYEGPEFPGVKIGQYYLFFKINEGDSFVYKVMKRLVDCYVTLDSDLPKRHVRQGLSHRNSLTAPQNRSSFRRILLPNRIHKNCPFPPLYGISYFVHLFLKTNTIMMH